MVVQITEMMQLASLEKVIRPHTPLVFFFHLILIPWNLFFGKPLFKGHKICLVTEKYSRNLCTIRYYG